MQDVFSRNRQALSIECDRIDYRLNPAPARNWSARALHRHSPRSSQPFIALNYGGDSQGFAWNPNCLAMSAAPLRGRKPCVAGRFEQAEGGTLFLDEIGDMPFDLQTRLLRVLSDGHFYRVGGHQPLKANVRVIAATHQNPGTACEGKACSVKTCTIDSMSFVCVCRACGSAAKIFRC